MSAEAIQAIAAAAAAILAPLAAAWSARQAKQINDLRADMDRLKKSELESRRLLRVAVRNIRDWLRWDTAGRIGLPPAIPDDLRDEV